MELVSSQPNGPSPSLEVHKLYRPIEFKLTSVYDSGKFAEKADSNPAANSTELTPRPTVTQYEFQTSWKSVHKIGPGFVNVGNTCFLNSVLQMLTYTPPFTNYLLEKVHSKKCKRRDTSQFCALCAFEGHVNKCFNGNAKTLQPTEILRNIKMINKKFRIGRQEDAQEFLRDLIDSFQKSATGFLDKPPQKVLENTDISRLFGGKLKSAVECKQCHHKSEIFESFFDLSLELSKSESIEKCMDVFFRAEELKGANKYRCSNCKKLVEATKKFSIHQRPIVLTIHLKRFDNAFMRINKISRHIKFNETISLSPYVSEKSPEPLLYDLQGIVIHMGSFCSSGHYFSYVKNSNNVWHLMNDEDVRTSKIDKVLSQNAYLLTYVLRSAPKKVEIVPQPKMEVKAEVHEKKMETEEDKKQPVKESAQKTKAQVNGVVKGKEMKDEKKEKPTVRQVSAPKEKEKMSVENGKVNGVTSSVNTPKKAVVENGKMDGISQPNTKKMKMDEEPRQIGSASTSANKDKDKVQGKMQTEEANAEEKKADKTFDRLSKINPTDFAGSTSLNGLLSHLVESKKSSDIIDDIFKKGGKKNGDVKIERAKTSISLGSGKGEAMEEEAKGQDKVQKSKLDVNTEERVKESEKIPYSTQLGALLDQKEAKVYMKQLESSVTKNNKSPIKRSLSMGNVPNPPPADDEEENDTGFTIAKKPGSVAKVSSTMLKKSPFEKLKRIARVISLFPVKKRKGEVKEHVESYDGHMETEETERGNKTVVVKQIKPQANGKVTHKPEQQQQKPQQQTQTQTQPQQQQQQKGSPKKEKRYFLKGENELKGLEKDVEEWDIGEDGDINEVKEIKEQKKKVETENAGFFITPKKVKDEYDLEYDKGKQKKVKKKQKGKKVKANNFQKTYEYLKRAGRKYNN